MFDCGGLRREICCDYLQALGAEPKEVTGEAASLLVDADDEVERPSGM